MKKTRMYAERKANIGLFTGCLYNCLYCNFRKIFIRFGKSFEPHFHPEKLNKTPPKTKGEEFVSIGLAGDIAFASDNEMEKIIYYCNYWSDRTFLIQSKNPSRFLDFDFPKNIIIATTIESDKPYKISKAPPPKKRFEAMKSIDNQKLVAIEPILNFDFKNLLTMIKDINPSVVYIGYASGMYKLPEPPIQKTKELINGLRNICEIRLKYLKK